MFITEFKREWVQYITVP